MTSRIPSTDTTGRRLRRTALGMLAAALVSASLLVATPASAVNTTRYVDCSQSFNGSGTQTSPLNSVAAVNAITYGAGDRVLLKAGTTCIGQLAPKGSGVSGSPVVLSSYGTGAKPIIDAAGAVGPVIALANIQQWELSGLELRNAASSPAFRSGVLATNSTGGALNHIVVTGMTIRNISGWSGGWYTTNAGVGVQTNHTASISTYNDIVIADNTFANVDRIAVAVTPDYDGEGTGLTTNVKIQRNTIRYSGGDDILVVKGSGALIEGNDTAFGGAKSLYDCPPGQYCNGASASIWMAGSIGTVVQGNSVACFINEADGQAYDVDWGNRNTTVQYNYSRNNRGGLILLMPPINVPNEPTSQIPSDGTVVRYNVSQDDTSTEGCPLQPRSQGPKDVIHFAGGIPNRSGSSTAQPDIHNNTIFIPSNRATYIVGSRSGVSTSGSFLFRNNLVVNFGTGGYVQTNGSTYATNLLYGTRHSTEPVGAGTITSDPQLIGPLPTPSQASNGAASFRLRPSSPAIAAGTSIASNGGRDFAGTSIAAVPTVGAFEGSTGDLVQNGGFEASTLAPWTVSGNGTPAALTASTRFTGAKSLQTGPANSGAQQTVAGLAPSTTYAVTANLRVATQGEDIALGAKDFGGTDVFARSTATAWAPTTVYLTTGPSSTTATIYCYKNGGSGAGWCDAVSLQRVSAPANLVANSSFDSGTLTPWTLSGNGTSAAVSAAAARTGTSGLLTGAANSGAQQTVTGLAPGTSYVVTGWLRASTGEQIAVGVKDNGSAETFQQITGSTYTPASVTFTTGTNATSATVYCYKNSGSGAGACDDLRVTRVG